MPDATGWAILLAGALLGSTLGGVAGFGAGIVLLPLVVQVLGVRAAAPVLTVTMFLGNLARLWWSRGELDLRVATRFLLGAVPATAAGATLYAAATGDWVRWVVGGFLLAAGPLRRLLLAGGQPVRLSHFPLVGAAIGALSAVVVTVGPVLTPFFLAYGLRRGAFIATEAACALGMHLTRSVVFARYALLTWETAAVGTVLGAAMFVGAWLGRQLLERMSERVFVAVVEGLLVVMGLQLLVAAR